MKSILVAIVSTVMLVGCVSPTKINSNQPLNKFWFEIKGNIEPGYRLWERNGGGIWTETYPSGFNSKFKEVGRTKVNGLDGDYVVKVSGDEEKTSTKNGGFRVFFPDYQKDNKFIYFSKKTQNGWAVWDKSTLLIKPLATRDGAKVGDMPSVK